MKLSREQRWKYVGPYRDKVVNTGDTPTANLGTPCDKYSRSSGPIFKKGSKLNNRYKIIHIFYINETIDYLRGWHYRVVDFKTVDVYSIHQDTLVGLK